METVWTKNYKDYDFMKVNKDLKTPILIIGGGITGLMCAYGLMKEKKEFILVEGDKLATDANSYSIGEVSLGQEDIYQRINKQHGELTALEYFEMQSEGINKIEKLIIREKINCDYTKQDTIVHACEDKNLTSINDMYKQLQNFCEVSLLEDQIKPLNFKLGINFPGGGIFNPVKYANGIINILIKKDVKLYEYSKVININKIHDAYEVTVNGNIIITDKIIMTNNTPVKPFNNLYQPKINKYKTYVISFKSKLNLDTNYVNLDAPRLTLRSYDNETLIMSCSNYSNSLSSDEYYYELLTKEIKKLDKVAEIELKWFVEDYVSVDSLPIVGPYSKTHPNIIVVLALGKSCITNAHVSAEIAVSLISDDNPYNIFKPTRWTLTRDIKSNIKILSNVFTDLITSKIIKRKLNLNSMKVDSGFVARYRRQNILVYKEDKEVYIYFQNKCSHMGCLLSWNDTNKLWECKSDGSVFDKYGKLLSGPATSDLERLLY